MAVESVQAPAAQQASELEQGSIYLLPSLGAIGTTGLKQWDGWIHEEFLQRLRGRRGVEAYREMVDNSSVVGTIQVVIDRLVRQVQWSTKPSDENDPVAVEQAQFVEENRCDMSMTWEDFISEAFSFLTYGWSLHEIIYKQRQGDTDDGATRSKYSDGRYGWRKLAPRGQDTLWKWEFEDTDDGLRGMHQKDFYSGFSAFIPIEKALLFRTQSLKNNPEGRSIYRSAVIDYFFLKRIQELEAIGIEKDMTGIPVMEVPVSMLSSNATAADKSLVAELDKLVGSLKRGHREGAIIPSELDREGKPTGFKFRLMQSGGTKQVNTVEVKRDYRIAILQTAMAQFIQLGMAGTNGNRSLSVSSIDIFAVALKTYVNEVSTVMNRYAIPRLLRLNNMDPSRAPEIVAGDVIAPSLEEIVDIVLKLSQAQQIMPDTRSITNEILERASLPPLESAPAAQASSPQPSAAAQALLQSWMGSGGAQT